MKCFVTDDPEMAYLALMQGCGVGFTGDHKKFEEVSKRFHETYVNAAHKSAKRSPEESDAEGSREERILQAAREASEEAEAKGRTIVWGDRTLNADAVNWDKLNDRLRGFYIGLRQGGIQEGSDGVPLEERLRGEHTDY